MAAGLTHECGWRSKPSSSPAMAESALRRHSCDLARTRAARAQRVQQRLADPGVKRECHHKVANHQHGTHAAYVLDRCKCRPCRVANSLYEGTRARGKAYGTWAPFVAAGPARRHCRQLMGDGIGLKRIAALSGVPHGTLWKLVYGKKNHRGRKVPSKRIRLATESALLAVQATPAAFAGGARVDSTSTVDKLRQLVAAGWSQSKLAGRLNTEPSNFTGVMTRDHCSARMAREVAALYIELRHVAPPESTHREKISCSRARNLAKQRGWQPPPNRDLVLAPRVATESTTPYGWVAGVTEKMRQEAS